MTELADTQEQKSRVLKIRNVFRIEDMSYPFANGKIVLLVMIISFLKYEKVS